MIAKILLLIYAVLTLASNVIGYIAIPEDDGSKSRKQFLIFMIAVSCVLTFVTLISFWFGSGTTAPAGVPLPTLS